MKTVLVYPKTRNARDLIGLSQAVGRRKWNDILGQLKSQISPDLCLSDEAADRLRTWLARYYRYFCNDPEYCDWESTVSWINEGCLDYVI